MHALPGATWPPVKLQTAVRDGSQPSGSGLEDECDGRTPRRRSYLNRPTTIVSQRGRRRHHRASDDVLDPKRSPPRSSALSSRPPPPCCWRDRLTATGRGIYKRQRPARRQKRENSQSKGPLVGVSSAIGIGFSPDPTRHGRAAMSSSSPSLAPARS